MDSNLHLAGHKIRQFRHKRGLTVQAFTDMIVAKLERPQPIPRATVQNWESRGKVARPAVQRALIELGVCQAEDWLTPYLSEAA